MTPRERFLNTLSYAPVDRVPLWEEGIREETRRRWDTEGLPFADELNRYFHYDRHEEIPIHLGPLPGFRDPSSEPEVFVRLRDHYRPEPSRLPKDWSRLLKHWAQRDYPLGMTVWRGIFQTLGVEDWPTLERCLIALKDVPSVMERTLNAIADCATQTIEHALGGVMLDYVIFDEPIAGIYGSVISPASFRRFCVPFYRRLVDMLQTRGVQWFIVRTYGNPKALLPDWLDAGINVFWCYEATYGGVDYVALRREYGRHLRLVGGINIRAIEEGPAAIERALYPLVPWLLEDGGYLPMSDGRIRDNVPWAHYCHYRKRLEHLVGMHPYEERIR